MFFKKRLKQKKTALGICAGLFLLAAQYGCYKDNKQDLYPAGNGNCDTANIAWGKDINPMVQGSCVRSGCHDAIGAGGVRLTDYAGVKTIADNGSFLRVVTDGTMPQGSAKWDECRINKLRNWLNQGAPQN